MATLPLSDATDGMITVQGRISLTMASQGKLLVSLFEKILGFTVRIMLEVRRTVCQ